MIDERNPLLQALRDQVAADQQQRLRCQRGQHDMLATASSGVVVCRLCRTLGVCLWCGLTLPYGACVTVCAKHVGAVKQQARHRPLLNRLDPSHHAERSEPISETLYLTPAEADEIFKLAEAEIQPLLRNMRKERWTGRLQAAFCLCLMLTGLIGSVWQIINYPKTTVTLFPVVRSMSITTSLAMPLRTLAPVRLMRSATAQTTGHGHQDARAANGNLTFYNGLFTAQVVPMGTVFTGADGASVTTTESATIPATNPSANPPQLGYTVVTAEAIHSGAASNIAAFDINTTFINGVSVKNTIGFSGGRDARDYKAVAQPDIQNLTGSTTQTVNQALPQAFSLHPGEALQITTCSTKNTADHAPGYEAQMVTVKTVKTCSAVAYDSQELDTTATAAFTKARPAGYQLLGSVQTSVTSVTPFTVRLTGSWVFVVSKEYEQHLAEQIAGESPGQAKAYLLHTGVISQASIPATLPQEMYIQFVVIVGL